MMTDVVIVPNPQNKTAEPPKTCDHCAFLTILFTCKPKYLVENVQKNK